jgi:predicted phage replisome organizer
MPKKYYWLKLDRHYFDRHDIKILEAMPDGKQISLFYLKLMLESVDHEGRLRFSDEIPYTESMLASVTRIDEPIVHTAMDILLKLGLAQIEEDRTILMVDVPKMLGSETSWAAKKREYRGQKEDNVRTESETCPTESDQESDPEPEERIGKDIVSSSRADAALSSYRENFGAAGSMQLKEMIQFYGEDVVFKAVDMSIGRANKTPIRYVNEVCCQLTSYKKEYKL